QPDQPLADALRTAVAALAGDRRLAPVELEVAVLSRANGRRAFRRLTQDDVAGAPGGGAAAAAEDAPAAAPAATPTIEATTQPESAADSGDAGGDEGDAG